MPRPKGIENPSNLGENGMSQFLRKQTSNLESTDEDTLPNEFLDSSTMVFSSLFQALEQAGVIESRPAAIQGVNHAH